MRHSVAALVKSQERSLSSRLMRADEVVNELAAVKGWLAEGLISNEQATSLSETTKGRLRLSVDAPEAMEEEEEEEARRRPPTASTTNPEDGHFFPWHKHVVTSLSAAGCPLLSAASCLLVSACRLSAVRCPLSAVGCRLSAVRSPLSTAYFI